MEKIVRERGAAAFERAAFVRREVDGHRADLAGRDRVPSGTPALRVDQGDEDHVGAADEDLSRSHQAPRSDAALRRDDHARAGARRSGARRRGDRGRQVPGPAARHSVRREGSLLDEGRAHDVGIEGLREPHHRRGRRSRRAAAQRGRGADRQARDRALRAGRSVVSRPHEQSVGHPPRIERIVGRARRRRRRRAASRSASARRRRDRSSRPRASAA